MTEKKVLGFKLPPRLEQVGDEHSECVQPANIAQHDAMNLPHHANPGRMEFSERTRTHLGGVVATSSLSAGHRIRRGGFEDVVQPSATRPAIPRGPRYLRPLRRERWNRSASRQWIFRRIVASYAHHPVKLPPAGKKRQRATKMPIATSIARSQA